MKQKYLIAIIIVLVAGALVAGFGLLSFRAIQSQTGRDSSMASSTGDSQANTQPAAVDVTGLYVGGDEQLGRALQAELTRQLQQKAGFGQVQVVNQAVDRTEIPFVFVEVSRQNFVWTPFYGKAELVVKVSYASNGDVSFRHTQPTEFHFEGEPPSLKRSGQYTFRDVSWGIMSLPGYQDFLAAQIAAAILGDL